MRSREEGSSTKNLSLGDRPVCCPVSAERAPVETTLASPRRTACSKRAVADRLCHTRAAGSTPRYPSKGFSCNCMTSLMIAAQLWPRARGSHVGAHPAGCAAGSEPPCAAAESPCPLCPAYDRLNPLTACPRAGFHCRSWGQPPWVRGGGVRWPLRPPVGGRFSPWVAGAGPETPPLWV